MEFGEDFEKAANFYTLWELTYPFPKHFEDDIPFPKVEW